MTDFTIKARIDTEPDGALVVRGEYVNAGVDRPQTTGVMFKSTHRKLAERYKRAVEAGAVFHGHEVRTDVNGKTYVSASSRVLARMANADLNRLGF